MDLNSSKANSWVMGIIALLACAAFFLAGLAQAVFIVIASVSVWLFFQTVNRRLFSVLPKHGDLPHDHIFKRLWRVFVEVILQYRVVRDRPVVGILHAFILWGFLAFGWISANHMLLGMRGLDKASGERSWYGAFVAVWAVAVLVGIIGLSFRRFVLRPKALGKLSLTSGAVAFLISALMVTYLLGWGVFPVGSPSWKVNWWLHTLSFFALLVVIPISKHLHLVLAPVTIFFRPETTSSMRALREDGDDLGMIHFKDLGRKDVLDVDACVECGRCTDALPRQPLGRNAESQRNHPGPAPRPSVRRRCGGRNGGRKETGQGLSLPRTTCSSAFPAAPASMCVRWASSTWAGKSSTFGADWPAKAASRTTGSNQLFTTMERAPHNPWGIAHDTRQKLIESKQFPIFDGTQEWLFWLGCGLSFDPHGQAVAQAMRQLLDAAGISWGVLARETCCGEPARRAGNEYLFMELSGKLVESFESARVKKIVTCCPHCTTMLDKDYRQIASYAQLGIEVVHHTEFIEQVLPKLPIKPSDMKATYHDPCYLARGRGITAAPREILRAAGVAITEAAHHGQNTQCCGAGGAQLFVADDTREQGKARVNQRRFTELMQTRATTVVVACPYCPIMLRDAANALKRDDVEILDVAEIVARNLAPKAGVDPAPV